MNYAYDESYASGKCSLTFKGWKYWGETISYGAIYNLKGTQIKLEDKKIYISKNGIDISENFEEEINWFEKEPFNRIFLSILFRKVLAF